MADQITKDKSLDIKPLIGVMMMVIMSSIMISMIGSGFGSESGGTGEDETTPTPPNDEEEQVEQDPETGQYACTLCSGEFDTYDDLYSHFIYVHPINYVTVEWSAD